MIRRDSMKRLAVCLLLVLMTSLTLCAAAAETLGWGFVNASDVALRREAGGRVIARLPEGTCVWIVSSAADSSGVLWHEIRAGLHVDHANYDFSGWMMADFIDAGEEVWHDISAIAASPCGLIALRSDGSTETAGRPIVSMDGAAWVSPRGWAASYGPAIRVGVPNTGNAYFIVTQDNELVSSVTGQPIPDGLAVAAQLEAAEEVIRGVPFPAWHSDCVLFRAVGIANAGSEWPLEVYVGVMADGSVRAEPAFMAELLADWSSIVDVRLTSRYVLGLRSDGTVLLAGIGDQVDLDVSGWRDVVAIGAGNDWCVGLLSDGTLVFSGDHTIMNEGHSRK